MAAGGLLDLQRKRQSRELAQGTPRQRLLNRLHRSLDDLKGEVTDICDEIFKALRQLRGDEVLQTLQQLALQLQDVNDRLDMLPLASAAAPPPLRSRCVGQLEGEDLRRLRRRRREVVLDIQAELEQLDAFLQGLREVRHAVGLLNTLLDELCQQNDSFVCPVMHDVMRRPVTVSSGKTYDAAALREMRKHAEEAGAQPLCPLTCQPLRPWEDRPNVVLQRLIDSAVEAAIAGSGASAADQGAMLRRWRQEAR
ncbi:hypothetical protein ABPG75_001310 [Micractinium tetrahymenae]